MILRKGYNFPRKMARVQNLGEPRSGCLLVDGHDFIGEWFRRDRRRLAKPCQRQLLPGIGLQPGDFLPPDADVACRLVNESFELAMLVFGAMEQKSGFDPMDEFHGVASLSHSFGPANLAGWIGSIPDKSIRGSLPAVGLEPTLPFLENGF